LAQHGNFFGQQQFHQWRDAAGLQLNVNTGELKGTPTRRKLFIAMNVSAGPDMVYEQYNL